MTNKQIIIEDCPYQGECSVSGCKRNDDGCFVRQLFEERYRAENQIVELNKTIKAKEQECEELKEARKNSRCAWKSLEGTFCPQAQEQLEAYKMEAEEYKRMGEYFSKLDNEVSNDMENN